MSWQYIDIIVTIDIQSWPAKYDYRASEELPRRTCGEKED